MNCTEKCELARTPPQSHHRISQTAEALESRFGGDNKRHKVMLFPKTLGLSPPRMTGIVDHMNSTTNKELHPKTIESKRFPIVEGSRSSTKRHKVLNHDPLKEIRRKTLSTPRNQPKNENTK
jgi:hypothetical protein